jgi:hypothetical protein
VPRDRLPVAAARRAGAAGADAQFLLSNTIGIAASSTSTGTAATPVG